MDKKATLTLADGKSLDFPVLSGSIGPEVIDIRTLYGKSGMFTYDPGFLSTASCNSSITYIDGDAGVLLYRGYPIEQLVQQVQRLFVKAGGLVLQEALQHDVQLEQAAPALPFEPVLRDSAGQGRHHRRVRRIRRPA